MSRHPDINAATLIRNHDVRPRIGGLLVHVHPGLQQEFAALAKDIWRDLQARFAAPLTLKASARRRSVTVLGLIRYVVSGKDGRLTLEQAALSESGRRVWRRARFTFAADLPFKPTTGLFEELLGEWAPQLGTLARSPSDISPLTAGLVSSMRRASLRTVEWKRLRYAVREALALDPEILELARRSRVNTHAREVTDAHYNHVANHLCGIPPDPRGQPEPPLAIRTGTGRACQSAAQGGSARHPAGKDPVGLLAASRRLALPREWPAAGLSRGARLAGAACAARRALAGTA